MPNIILLIAFFGVESAAMCQSHGGVEQYSYIEKGSSVIVPKAFYQSRQNWYGEVNYNYVEQQSLSVAAGKVFSHKGFADYSITPIAGIVMGKLNGGSAGFDITLEHKHFFFSSESRYTFSFERRTQNCFFNWLEAGYFLGAGIYAGMALQGTRSNKTESGLDPGIMIGFIYKNWTFPVYAFSSALKNTNYVFGMDWEWKHKRSGKIK